MLQTGWRGNSGYCQGLFNNTSREHLSITVQGRSFVQRICEASLRRRNLKTQLISTAGRNPSRQLISTAGRNPSRKRSSNRKNLEMAVFRFRLNGKYLFWKRIFAKTRTARLKDVISLTEFSSNTNTEWPLLVSFFSRILTAHCGWRVKLLFVRGPT